MPYGKSPAKMGHKDSAMKMKGSWMSKHVQDLFKEMPIDNKASALEMGHSPMEMGHSPAKMGHSPLEKNETPAERKARLKKENQAELARLKELTAKRKAKEEADKNKPKIKDQTKLQALKARVKSDLTGKTGKGGPGSSRN